VFFNEGHNLFPKSGPAKQKVIEQSMAPYKPVNASADLLNDPIYTGEFENTTPFISKNKNVV
jgi:hypothetical protein